MQSTMNLNGVPRQDGCVLDNPPRKKGQMWSWRSSKGSGDGPQTSGSTMPRGWKQKKQKALVDYSDPQRTTFILEKEDNESFGFEIQTYGLQLSSHSKVEMCTLVCTVNKDGAADCAGLTAGEIILTVNGQSIEGLAHHYIVDAVRQSTNVLKIETVCGSLLRRIELDRKMSLLKQTLQEKWVELQTLELQEQRLMRGDSRDGALTPSFLDSPVYPDVFPGHEGHRGPGGHRFSSDSSYQSYMTEDSDQASVFGDMISPSPAAAGDGCFFSQGFPEQRESRRSFSVHLQRRTSSSDSGSPSPKYWDEAGASSLFGTLPRKGRRGSVRRHLLKLIPGFHRSVEEEEVHPNKPCSLDTVFTAGQNQQNKETKASS
ncbi:unnamed protein product [Merluccius merluccius]